MRRRAFVAGFGGAIAMPFAVRSQQLGRVRRIGVLMGGAESDPVIRAYFAAFREALVKLGWAEGRNLHIDIRYSDGSGALTRFQAAELVSLAPEVILTQSGAATEAMRLQTQTIPIVSSSAGDQHLTRLAGNIARPEHNITGFSVLYSTIAGKWLQLLKEVAPQMTRVAVIYNPQTGDGANSDYRVSIEQASIALGVRAENAPFVSNMELESVINTFASEPNGGLIIMASATTATRDNRQLLLLLAARHRLPVIHWDKPYPAEGGLMSYGSDTIDLHRRSATYVDRILRGATISELPVQYPTKFELVVNLKAARIIDLAISESFLLRADQVIE